MRRTRRDPARTTFGVIAVTSNLDGTGHVLLIEGINMAGTEAAADYLFSDASKALVEPDLRLKRQHASSLKCCLRRAISERMPLALGSFLSALFEGRVTEAPSHPYFSILTVPMI